MEVLIFLVPLALGLGLAALAGFLWALNSGQYEDLTAPPGAPSWTTSSRRIVPGRKETDEFGGAVVRHDCGLTTRSRFPVTFAPSADPSGGRHARL
jgi:cbb3-type cytochrome oxidase maturation protein